MYPGCPLFVLMVWPAIIPKLRFLLSRCTCIYNGGRLSLSLPAAPQALLAVISLTCLVVAGLGTAMSEMAAMPAGREEGAWRSTVCVVQAAGGGFSRGR